MALNKKETEKLKIISEKIFMALNEEELIFLKDFIHKHWYRCLYTLIWFDFVPILRNH